MSDVEQPQRHRFILDREVFQDTGERLCAECGQDRAAEPFGCHY